MTNVSKIDQHGIRAKRELFAQFQQSTNLQKLIDVFTEELDELESVFHQLLVERNVTNAVGNQLDIIGEIVGQAREGRTDDEYRTAIRFKIAINTANSTEPSITSAAKLLLNFTEVSIQETFPAALEINTNGIIVDLSVLSQLVNLVGAAIGPLVVTFTNGHSPFVFSGDLTGKGFSDDRTSPGNLEQDAGVLSSRFLVGDNFYDTTHSELLSLTSGTFNNLVKQGHFFEGIDNWNIGSGNDVGDAVLTWDDKAASNGNGVLCLQNDTNGSTEVNYIFGIPTESGTTYNFSALVNPDEAGHTSTLKLGTAPGLSDLSSTALVGPGTISTTWLSSGQEVFITLANGANVGAGKDTVEWDEVIFKPQGSTTTESDIDDFRDDVGMEQYLNSKLYHYSSGNDKGNATSSIVMEGNFVVEFTLLTGSDVTTRQSILVDTNTVPVDGIFLVNGGIGLRVASTDHDISANIQPNTEYKIVLQRLKDQLILTVNGDKKSPISVATGDVTVKFFANALSAVFPQIALWSFGIAHTAGSHFWTMAEGTSTLVDQRGSNDITIDNHIQAQWMLGKARNNTFFLQELQASASQLRDQFPFAAFNTSADTAVTDYENNPNDLDKQIKAQVLTDYIVDRTIQKSYQDRIDAV